MWAFLQHVCIEKLDGHRLEGNYYVVKKAPKTNKLIFNHLSIQFTFINIDMFFNLNKSNGIIYWIENFPFCLTKKCKFWGNFFLFLTYGRSRNAWRIMCKTEQADHVWRKKKAKQGYSNCNCRRCSCSCRKYGQSICFRQINWPLCHRLVALIVSKSW